MRNPNLWKSSLAEQSHFQQEALGALLANVRNNSPFYARHLAGYSSNNLAGLPFTTKQDMQVHNMDFLCVPRSEIREYTATSGTMGKPVTVALTEKDLDRLAYNEAQSFGCAGGLPGDVYQLLLTLDRQFMAGMAYYNGIRAMGAASIRTGPGLPAMQWEVAQRLHTTVMVAVPSFLLQLARRAAGHGINLSQVSVKSAVCIGEGLRHADFSLNALGMALQQEWPSLKLHSTYAATELQTAFTECSEGRGGHLQPDLVIVEIIDPESLEPLPDGHPGEIVVTTTGVEGMPLLRYRTGDIAALHSEPCACGRTSKRLGPVLGRLQQMIKLRGTTLYPPAIFDLLNEAHFVDAYVVEAFTGTLGTDELRLHLHTALSAAECTAQIRPMLQSSLRVVPELLYHSEAGIRAMQMPEGGRKVIRFLDHRR